MEETCELMVSEHMFVIFATHHVMCSTNALQDEQTNETCSHMLLIPLHPSCNFSSML